MFSQLTKTIKNNATTQQIPSLTLVPLEHRKKCKHKKVPSSLKLSRIFYEHPGFSNQEFCIGQPCGQGVPTVLNLPDMLMRWDRTAAKNTLVGNCTPSLPRNHNSVTLQNLTRKYQAPNRLQKVQFSLIFYMSIQNQCSWCSNSISALVNTQLRLTTLSHDG
jgi:hypothetical protein